jgi:hypothetical protein
LPGPGIKEEAIGTLALTCSYSRYPAVVIGTSARTTETSSATSFRLE